MKPNYGFQREVFDVLEEHGPLAYTSIYKHLKAKGSQIKPKQVRKALDNLRSRGFAVRTKTDRRKYTIVIANQIEIETETPDPIQSPSLVEKTPESVGITPTEGLIDERTLGELKQSILVKAITLAGMLSVIAIVSVVTAVLTINFLGVV